MNSNEDIIKNTQNKDRVNMILAVIGIVVIVPVIWIAFYHFSSGSAKSTHNQILDDLGLAKNVTGKSSAPYYKWGWRKGTDERVWGERIVRQAFKKANLWLSADDLLFFKETCDAYAGGNTVDENSIQTRIEKILERSGEITNCATNQIRAIVQDVISISDAEANQHLKEQGVHPKADKAQFQLGLLRFRRMMTKAGEEILGLDSNGLAVKNEEGQLLFMLKGLDGWDHWLKSCQEEVKRINVSRSPSRNPSLLRNLKSNFQSSILQSHENDLIGSKKFMASLEEEIQQGDLKITQKRVEKLVSIFYYWLFTDAIPFNSADHKRIRDFLCRKDLATHFRQIVLEAITQDYLSLRNLVNTFPKKVIFYGKNPHARAFASQQYMTHLEIIIKTLVTTSKQSYPPGLIVITAKQMQEAREYAAEMEEMPDRRKKDEPPPRRDYLPELLDKQKHLSIVERNIDERTAEMWGWMVDIDVDDFTPKEYAHLDKGVYRSFIRFLCDGFGNIDFTSQSKHAKEKRVQYFQAVLDKLLKSPSL